MRRGTYSIVARDPETGELGGAVQSHWFSVGSIVLWARPGVGAVATQSVADPSYGPRTLDRMDSGLGAGVAMAELLDADSESELRQVAAIGPTGEPAAHTGTGCIPDAGDAQGAHHSAQANLMASPNVWPAMSAAFEAATGPLAHRLLAALDAAEAAGGDVRGRQSAAFLVVPSSGEAWERVVELRVEDHADPLGELRRLLGLQRAYELAGRGDELMAADQPVEAGALYRRAAELAPESDELLFWSGLALAHSGDLDAGVDAVRRAVQVHPGWAVLLDRLSPDFAPAGPQVRQALGRGN